MRARVGVIAFAVVAILGMAALLASAANDQRWTAFSLFVPAREPVGMLTPGQQACQGPVTVPSAFGGVQAWIASSPAPGAALEVSVDDAGTHALRAVGGMVQEPASLTSPSAVLSATLPPNRAVSICLRNVGSKAVTLLGSGPSDRSGTVSLRGRPTAFSTSLVLLRRRPKSLLSLVPTMFDRAALFRPGWVGAWTFWALTAGLVAGFGLAALGIAYAARSDMCSTERTSAQ